MYRRLRSHFRTDSPKPGYTGSLCRSSALVMFRQAFSMRMWSNGSYVEIERYRFLQFEFSVGSWRAVSRIEKKFRERNRFDEIRSTNPGFCGSACVYNLHKCSREIRRGSRSKSGCRLRRGYQSARRQGLRTHRVEAFRSEWNLRPHLDYLLRASVVDRIASRSHT